jgi:predicted Rossmann-fold nucleotide-binding protein
LISLEPTLSSAWIGQKVHKAKSGWTTLKVSINAGYAAYGGISIGLMGATADAALSGGAEVRGVLPRNLQDREIA